MPHIAAGTSGFAYTSWKPDFYPKEIPQKRFLEHYAKRLNAVEINYTFRRLPSAETLANWVELTPAGFQFALKAHMKITHVLKLKSALEFTDVFLRAIDPLRSARRLGPVLFQLPPSFKKDLSVLDQYLAALPRDICTAVEFRHTSWLDPDVYDILRKHQACLCLAESETLEVPPVITAEFVYFRLRKPQYTAADLEAIRSRAENLVAAGHDVFLFFKHEETADGALYAEQVLRMSRTATT